MHRWSWGMEVFFFHEPQPTGTAMRTLADVDRVYKYE